MTSRDVTEDAENANMHSYFNSVNVVDDTRSSAVAKTVEIYAKLLHGCTTKITFAKVCSK